MMRLHRVQSAAVLMAATALSGLMTGGCGPSGPIVIVDRNSNPTLDRLTAIGFAYREAYTRIGRPPKSVNDLRSIMNETGTSDESLVSPRDGKPFEFAWGKAFFLVPHPDRVPTILIHEAIGKDGSRYVYWDIGATELLSEEKFLLAKRGTKP